MKLLIVGIIGVLCSLVPFNRAEARGTYRYFVDRDWARMQVQIETEKKRLEAIEDEAEKSLQEIIESDRPAVEDRSKSRNR